MNSDTPKGGIATPESPPPITLTPQTERVPAPASYPPYQHPYSPASYRYPPVPPPKLGGEHLATWIIGGIATLVVLAGLVVALMASLVGVFVFSALNQHEVNATTTKTFAVSGTPSLVISDAAGNVTIQQVVGNQVTVQVTKHAWGTSDAVAKGALHSTVVDMSQNGTTITVSMQWSGPTRRSVDLIVNVPAEASADVHMGAGNIDARQFTGAISLDTGAGNITADAVTFAGMSRLHTGAGNVTVDATMASRAALDVLVGAGNVTLTLPSDTPAHLTASTGIGSVTITGWQIPVSGAIGHSASGDLNGNPTGTLTIQVGTGNLTLMIR